MTWNYYEKKREEVSPVQPSPVQCPASPQIQRKKEQKKVSKERSSPKILKLKPSNNQVPSSGFALVNVACPQSSATNNPLPGSIGCAGPAP